MGPQSWGFKDEVFCMSCAAPDEWHMKNEWKCHKKRPGAYDLFIYLYLYLLCINRAQKASLRPDFGDQKWRSCILRRLWVIGWSSLFTCILPHQCYNSMREFIIFGEHHLQWEIGRMFIVTFNFANKTHIPRHCPNGGVPNGKIKHHLQQIPNICRAGLAWVITVMNHNIQS